MMLRGYKLVVYFTAMLVTYSLIVGWGLIFGLIQYHTAYLLITPACFVPFIVYLIGFLQASNAERDWGLMLSSAGWACATAALLVQHNFLIFQYNYIGDRPDAFRGGLQSGALLFSVLAVAFIAGGAVLSLSAWNRERAALRNAFHDEELRRNARRGQF